MLKILIILIFSDIYYFITLFNFGANFSPLHNDDIPGYSTFNDGSVRKRHPNTVYPHCFTILFPFLFKIIGSYVTILTLFISHTSVSFLKSIFRLLYNIFINNTSLIKNINTVYINTKLFLSHYRFH